jgi:primosomal protein N' (replication factor Y)
MKHYQVLLPLSLPAAFTYAAPYGMEVGIGDFVEVPVGGKKHIGVVWAEGIKNQELRIKKDDSLDAPLPSYKIKQIIARLPAPPMPENLRKFIDWVAEYTMSPAGNVLKMAMSIPEALRPEKTIEAYRIWNKEPRIKEDSRDSRFLIPDSKITPSRQRVLDLLSSSKPLTAAQITEASGVGASVIKGLLQSGLIEKVEILPPATAINIKDFAVEFSPEQQLAVNDLCSKVAAEKYSATVLDGITGSGKTEVYFAAVAAALKLPVASCQLPDSSLASGNWQLATQILILLPEIALTTQLVSRFEAAFGFPPSVWHSGLTPKQREKNWRDIANGNARLVIGARSALFLPFKNLKLIVVDEEHDGSYKQEEGVIYQARDMAVVRANIEQIPIILASATPSIETVENVKAGKYSRLHLTSRHGEAVLPDIKVVDMRQQKLKAGLWLSSHLKKAINDNLQAGRQSMLFLNRRGYAPLMLCRECGYRFKCPDCASWLVEHKHPRKLMCHHCGYNHPVPEACPECNKKDMLVSCGPGVERVAEEVAKDFPDARVLLMTSDKMTSMSKAGNMIDDIESGKVDIIVGTQIMAKGYHFPNLTLVGIIDADLGLEGGDLRAAERTYQLLQQVSGRAGREKEKGAVIMQSYMPENMVMRSLAKGDRDEFVKTETTSRKLSNMPPYSRLAGVILSGHNDREVFLVARAIVAASPVQQSVRVLGPVPAPLFLLRGRYRYRILIQSPRNINLQSWIKSLLANVQIPAKVKVKVDIDPYSFM